MATPRKARSRRGIFVAAVSLLLCGVALYEWRQSLTRFDSVRLGNAVVMFADGKACLLHSNHPTPAAVRTGLSSVPHDHTAQPSRVPFNWPTFTFNRTTDASGETTLTAVAPVWSLAAAFAMQPAWWTLRRMRAVSPADED